MHILAVCTGNICRSPMAEGVLRELFSHVPGVVISSAGTHAVIGNPATEFSIIVAAEHGVDISSHRARELDSRMVRQSDAIVCMEPSHAELVLTLDLTAFRKVFNLADFSGQDARITTIADPYGCSLREYRACFLDIQTCIRKFLASDQFRLLGKAAARQVKT